MQDPAVVRLGVRQLEALSARFRILQGQQLQLRYNADTAATVRAWARIHYDHGIDSIIYVPDQVLTDDRVDAVISPSEVAMADGWVTDAVVECLSAGVKRGQVYVKLIVALESGAFGTVLCADYVYSTFGQVALGTYIQPGPGGGGGNLEMATLVDDLAPVLVTHTFALSNTIRNIYGFAWYYNASATAATRNLETELRTVYGAVPTGFTGVFALWIVTDLVLTASQEGIVFGDRKRAGTNDNGTLAIEDESANPVPFPLLVEENDTTTLAFDPQLAEATDRQSIYLLRESWVMPS